MKNIKFYIGIVIAMGCYSAHAQNSYVAPQPSDGNYILVRTYQKEKNNSTEIVLKTDVMENIQYFDGLGRAQQGIAIAQSPSETDIVSPIEYDGYGRMVREWLPFPEQPVVSGEFHIGSKAAAQQYYLQTYGQDFQGIVNSAEVNAYSEKKLEPSPLNRVLKQGAPGLDWVIGPDETDHTIGFEYGHNTHDPSNPNDNNKDNVRLFTINFLNGDTEVPSLLNNGYYLEKQLSKTKTKDENHASGNDHTTEEFTDKQGRVVLKRTYNDNVPHDTYYVYDDYGNLTYVLPPLVDTAISVDQTVLDNLCYQYVYDHRNRLVEKKLPGKVKEYIVYNNLDQPILTQDGVQRGSNQWLFTQYDVHGRVAYTGKAVIAGSRPTIQDAVTDLPDNHELWTARTENNSTTNTIGGKVLHYNTNGYPQVADITEVLTVNYYDDYNFDTGNEPAPPTQIFGANVSNLTKGMPTGSLVKVLSTNQWITTVTRYDAKARPIYTYSENEYLGTVDVVESELDFVGKPLKVRTEHTRNGVTVATLDNFEYDHVGRLLKQTQCIGNENLGYTCSGIVENQVVNDLSITTDITAPQSLTIKPANPGDVIVISGTITLKTDPTLGGSGGTEELIAYNDYDELGQLVRKNVGNTEASPLQKVDYAYNVRGWLKSINQDTDNLDDDQFNFGINYNTVAHGGTPLFNGNIAETEWETTNDNQLRWYRYTYDALNRITRGIGNDGKFDLGSTTDPIAYDKNGNIQTLLRMGHVVANPDIATASNYGTMDDLTYSYIGNQLMKVSDAATVDEFGFKDDISGANPDNVDDYAYDDNGNLTSDANKNITSIAYNHLNLPTSIVTSSGTISYIYDATGTKLQKTVSVGSSVTDYAGNYIYENGALQFFSTPEGYVTPDGMGGYDYVYQYKDHLGNIRLSYVDDGNGGLEIVEENNYYPFGLKHKGYNNVTSSYGNSVANKWKFGGKEYDDTFDINTYDFGARNYDPALGRWMNIDPLAEDYYNYSPYIYTANNPIYYTDPDGQRIIIHYQDEDGNDQQHIYEFGGSYDGDNQFIKDVYASLNYIAENNADVTGVIEALSGDKIGDVDVLQNTAENNPLIENSLFQTYYNSETNQIIFDPTQGAEVTETKGFLSWITGNGYSDEKGVLSPAENLLHELAHAKSSLEDPDQHKEDSKTDLSGGWDNREEYDVIRNVENPAAKKLGHVQRNNHRGRFVKVTSPTSIKPKKKKK